MTRVCPHCNAQLQATVPAYVNVEQVRGGILRASDCHLAFDDWRSSLASVEPDERPQLRFYCADGCDLNGLVHRFDADR